MVGLVVNIEIREADFTFPNFVPSLVLSLLNPLLNIFVNWNWNQAELSWAHYQITRTNFPNLTWLLAGVLDINEFRNYSFSVKQQIARGQFCQAWRIFMWLPNFPMKNFHINVPTNNPDGRSSGQISTFLSTCRHIIVGERETWPEDQLFNFSSCWNN